VDPDAIIRPHHNWKQLAASATSVLLPGEQLAAREEGPRHDLWQLAARNAFRVFESSS
jgi:hypothetical protein